MKTPILSIAAIAALCSAGAALAQSSTPPATRPSMQYRQPTPAASTAASPTSQPTNSSGQTPGTYNATGGTGGTASAGGTSASTLGLGATSQTPDQTSSALGMAGSAANANGSAQSRSAVHGSNVLNGQAMAQAHDGGTFSKSHTHCQVKDGSDPNCRTKTTAHEPGSKPVMSTTTTGESPQ